MVEQVRVESALLELHQRFQSAELVQLLLFVKLLLSPDIVEWSSWLSDLSRDLYAFFVEGRMETRLLFGFGFSLRVFVDVQNQILLVNAKGLNKAIITLKSL